MCCFTRNQKYMVRTEAVRNQEQNHARTTGISSSLAKGNRNIESPWPHQGFQPSLEKLLVRFLPHQGLHRTTAFSGPRIFAMPNKTWGEKNQIPSPGEIISLWKESSYWWEKPIVFHWTTKRYSWRIDCEFHLLDQQISTPVTCHWETCQHQRHIFMWLLAFLSQEQEHDFIGMLWVLENFWSDAIPVWLSIVVVIDRDVGLIVTIRHGYSSLTICKFVMAGQLKSACSWQSIICNLDGLDGILCSLTKGSVFADSRLVRETWEKLARQRRDKKARRRGDE